jgi:hypothetical protein
VCPPPACLVSRRACWFWHVFPRKLIPGRPPVLSEARSSTGRMLSNTRHQHAYKPRKWCAVGVRRAEHSECGFLGGFCLNTQASGSRKHNKQKAKSKKHARACCAGVPPFAWCRCYSHTWHVVSGVLCMLLCVIIRYEQGAAPRPKKKEVGEPRGAGGCVGQRPKKDQGPFFFDVLFYRGFGLPSPRNVQDVIKNKSRKKSVLDFWSIFL